MVRKSDVRLRAQPTANKTLTFNCRISVTAVLRNRRELVTKVTKQVVWSGVGRSEMAGEGRVSRVGRGMSSYCKKAQIYLCFFLQYTIQYNTIITWSSAPLSRHHYWSARTVLLSQVLKKEKKEEILKII